MAPSTPPPPRMRVFAALTTASTSSLAMSPWTTSSLTLVEPVETSVARAAPEGPHGQRRHHRGDEDRPPAREELRVVQREGRAGASRWAVAPELPGGLGQTRDGV